MEVRLGCQSVKHSHVTGAYLTNSVQESGPETLGEQLSLHLAREVCVVRVITEHVAEGPQALIAQFLTRVKLSVAFINSAFTESLTALPCSISCSKNGAAFVRCEACSVVPLARSAAEMRTYHSDNRL